MRNNNKGFTFVELLTATAILGIIIVAAGNLMVTGIKSYNNLSSLLRLQYESQLLMTQLEEYLVDSSAGVAWDDIDHTLYIANHDDSVVASQIKVYLFRWDESTGTILFNSGVGSDILTGINPSKLMAEHITSLNVTFPEDKQEATVDLKMTLNDYHYEAKQTIALRNRPKKAENWNELWPKLNE